MLYSYIVYIAYKDTGKIIIMRNIFYILSLNEEYLNIYWMWMACEWFWSRFVGAGRDDTYFLPIGSRVKYKWKWSLEEDVALTENMLLVFQQQEKCS